MQRLRVHIGPRLNDVVSYIAKDRSRLGNRNDIKRDKRQVNTHEIEINKDTIIRTSTQVRMARERHIYRTVKDSGRSLNYFPLYLTNRELKQ